MFIIKPKELVVLHIDYYRPDFRSVIQEFVWQTNDIWPEVPRIHQFLNYWKDNIHAIIRNVNVINCKNHEIRREI